MKGMSQADGAGDALVGEEPLETPYGQFTQSVEDAQSDVSAGDIGENEWFDKDDPLLDRMQNALRGQLERQDARVTLQLRESEEEVSRVLRRREDIGVELYGLQQSLAKQQMNLERFYEQYNDINSRRRTAEERVQNVRTKCDQKKQMLEERKREFRDAQKELDNLKTSLRHIKEYNSKMKEEINAARRDARGIEEGMQQLEKDKQTQDLLIVHMEEQITRMTNERDLHQSQIEAQRQETESARATLRESAIQMDAIRAEKREYQTKWRTALVGVQRRDEALRAAEKALQEVRERIIALEHEVAGYEQEVEQQDVQNEDIRSQLASVQAQLEVEKTKKAEAVAAVKELEEKNTAAQEQLETVDLQNRRVAVTTGKLKSANSEVTKKVEKQVRRKQEIESVMDEMMSDKTTLRHGAQNTYKSIRLVRADIHEKELALGKLHNDVARVKVESLGASAEVSSLQITVDSHEGHLRDSDAVVENYEADMKNRADEIRKKQMYIERLNRKFDQLTQGMEEANLGPYEATIKNLKKEIVKAGDANEDMQKTWIRHQTELVDIATVAETEEDKVDGLKSREVILRQKSLRLEGEVTRNQRDIAGLSRNIKDMRVEIVKLNRLVAVHRELLVKLKEKRYSTSIEFEDRIQEDRDHLKKQSALAEKLADEKRELLEGITESERQILLWERKIQLEIETQQTLDPSYGRREVEEMKREVHRMELRVTQIRRKQEEMIKEMELAVNKRESIQMRNAGKSRQQMTQAAVRKQVGSLKAQLRTNLKEGRGLQTIIAKQDGENEALRNDLESLQQNYNEVEDRKVDLANHVADMYFQKQINLETLRLMQQKSQAIGKINSGGAPSGLSKAPELLQRRKQEYHQIVASLNELAELHPKHQKWLTKLVAAFPEA